MNRKQKVLEWAFWKCHQAGDRYNLYDIIFKYETILNASEEEQEAIMDYISGRMGLRKSENDSKEMKLLQDKEWLEKPDFDKELIGTKSYKRNVWFNK